MIPNKVFYAEARAEIAEGGATVTLDGRPIRTPGKTPFVVPSESLAEAIAAEWQAQSDTIRPETMPLTRLANSAIDKIPAQLDETIAALAAYAETDMTCFRAESPQSLVERQSAAWDPLLVWLNSTHGLTLVQTTGILPVDQPKPSLEAFRDWLEPQAPFALMALHDLIGLSGSIVLARALAEDAITEEAAWQASVVDEMWNIEAWGDDEEAARQRAGKQAGFKAANRFFRLQSQKA